MSRSVIHDHITLSTTIGNNIKNVIYPTNTSLDVLLQSSNPAIAEFGDILNEIINKLGVLAFLNSVIDDSTPNGYKLATEDEPESLEIVSDDIDSDLFNPDTMIKISDVRDAMDIPEGEEFPFVIGDYVVRDDYSTDMTWSASKIYVELANIVTSIKEYTLSKEEIEEQLDNLLLLINSAIDSQNSTINTINTIINNNINELEKWRNELLRNILIIPPNVTGIPLNDYNGIIDTTQVDTYRTYTKWLIVRDDRKYSLFEPTEEQPDPPEDAKMIVSSYLPCTIDDDNKIQIVESTNSGAPEDDDNNPTIVNPTKIPVGFLSGDPKFNGKPIGTVGLYVRRYTEEEFGDMTGKVPYDEVRFDIRKPDVQCSTGEAGGEKYALNFNFDYSKHIYLSEINGAEALCPYLTTKWDVDMDYWLSSFNPPELKLCDASDAYNINLTHNGLTIDKDLSRVTSYFNSAQGDSHTDILDVNDERIYPKIPVAHSVVFTTDDNNETTEELGYYNSYDSDGVSFFGPKGV